MANRKIKIRYIKAYDFKITLATGVYGGITNHGLINVNFFNERAVIPDSETLEVDDRGVPVGNPKAEKDGDMTRELQSGIILDTNTAKVVIAWLETKIKEQETLFKVK